MTTINESDVPISVKKRFALASSEGDAVVMSNIIDENGDVSPKDIVTAVRYALRNNQADVLQMFKEKGYTNNCTLSGICRRNSLAVVKLFVSENVTDKETQVLLRISISNPDVEVFKYLFDLLPVVYNPIALLITVYNLGRLDIAEFLASQGMIPQTKRLGIMKRSKAVASYYESLVQSTE